MALLQIQRKVERAKHSQGSLAPRDNEVATIKLICTKSTFPSCRSAAFRGDLVGGGTVSATEPPADVAASGVTAREWGEFLKRVNARAAGYPWAGTGKWLVLAFFTTLILFIVMLGKNADIKKDDNATDAEKAAAEKSDKTWNMIGSLVTVACFVVYYCSRCRLGSANTALKAALAKATEGWEKKHGVRCVLKPATATTYRAHQYFGDNHFSADKAQRERDAQRARVARGEAPRKAGCRDLPGPCHPSDPAEIWIHTKVKAEPSGGGGGGGGGEVEVVVTLQELGEVDAAPPQAEEDASETSAMATT